MFVILKAKVELDQQQNAIIFYFKDPMMQQIWELGRIFLISALKSMVSKFRMFLIFLGI